MKIKNSDIHREVRFRGRLIRLLVPYFTPRKFRMNNSFMNMFLKGRWLGRETRMKEQYISRPDGSKLRLCICRSKEGTRAEAAGLLWLHGGGYAMGLPEQDYRFIDSFCRDGRCLAVVPDYRLSEASPYPAAIEDCYAALIFMKNHADELGIRKDQLFVGGDSAGGGLAAALCLYARDKREVAIAFQMPLYPMLDDRVNLSSADNDAPGWNSRSNRLAWSMYLDGQSPDEYFAPARADSCAGLPPACSFIGTIDPFYDETILYMQCLKEQGIKVHFMEFAGCFHGFDIVCPRSAPARKARVFLTDTLRCALLNYFAPQPDTSDKA